MSNNNVNNLSLLEELEIEVEVSRRHNEHEYETSWEDQTGILLTRHTVEQIVKNLKQIERLKQLKEQNTAG